MDTMLAVLASAAKGGWRTSEFWLSAFAIVLPYATRGAEQVPGAGGVVVQVAVAAAGAAAAGAYALSRAKVKGDVVKAASEPAASEIAHAIAGGARPTTDGASP